MINKKNIVILVSVIVVLTLLTVFVFLWSGPSDSDDNTVNEASDVIKIFEGDADLLSHINVVTPDESINFVKNSESQWSIEGINSDKIKNYKITTLASTVSAINAKNIIEENATELDKYGLANPLYTLNATFGDMTKTFYGGNSTSLGDAYYFKGADSNTVYTIYASTFNSIFDGTLSYREIPDFSVNTETVCGVKVQKQDTTLNVQLMETPVVINDYNVATWEMTSPSYHTIDDSRLATYIMEVLPNIYVNEFVSDKGNLADYGLDKPYAVVTITNTDGNVQTIKLGTSNQDEYYVVLGDDTTVYTAGKDAFSFVDIEPFLLVNKFVNLVGVDDVSYVKVKSGSSEYKLSYSDGKYYLNSKEVSEDDYKKTLYTAVIGLLVSDFCNDATYKQPAVTVEYCTTNGKVTKAEFVDYNDRNYAVYKDGKCEFMILKKDVTSVIDLLDSYDK